ncbi:TOBE domain-containing protein [Streptomyces hirsutus]|uniref:TOBE domain-containing protein n=1 Tax=Streptomyces hirsutus TaxID=35620 RepID=UPI0036389BFD
MPTPGQDERDREERDGGGAEALAFITPEAVSAHPRQARRAVRATWPDTVREITASGSRLRVLITSEHAPELVAEIPRQAATELGLAGGTPVFTSVKATETTIVAV